MRTTQPITDPIRKRETSAPSFAPLRLSATLFTAAVLLHNGDHLRRGVGSVGADVFWLGVFGILLEVAVVVLIFMDHPTAPLAAVSAGVGLAAGYLFVHFTPSRTWLSDSFTSGSPGALSVLAAGFETVAALLLAAAGLSVLRRRGLASSAGGESTGTIPGALRHPVVAAMVGGNLLMLIATAVTR